MTEKANKPRLRYKQNIETPLGVSPSSVSSLEKTSSETTPVSRLGKTEIGYSGLMLRNNLNKLTYIEEEQTEDLSWPHSLDTYSAMLKDDAVAVALRAKKTLIIGSLQNRKILPGDPEDEQSVEAARWVDWSLRNLEGQTFFSLLQDICTYNEYGFSAFEKVWGTVDSGEYAGRVKLRKIAGRSQKSLDDSTPVSYSQDGRTFLGLNQSRRNLPNYLAIPSNSDYTNVIDIPANRLMMFSYEGYYNNVLGNSPLKSVYIAWKEKKIIEEYQVIGISKDLGKHIIKLFKFYLLPLYIEICIEQHI